MSDELETLMSFSGPADIILTIKPGDDLEQYLKNVRTLEDRANRWAHKTTRKEYTSWNGSIMAEFEIVYTVRLRMDLRFICNQSITVSTPEEAKNALMALRVMGFGENPELLVSQSEEKDAGSIQTAHEALDSAASP